MSYQRGKKRGAIEQSEPIDNDSNVEEVISFHRIFIENCFFQFHLHYYYVALIVPQLVEVLRYK